MNAVRTFRYTLSGFIIGVVMALMTFGEDPFSEDRMHRAELLGAAFGGGGLLGALLGGVVDAARAVLRGVRRDTA
jgi:hypothetical protein